MWSRETPATAHPDPRTRLVFVMGAFGIHIEFMKIIGLVAGVGWATMASAVAQGGIPGNPMVTPKNFKMRPVGGSVNPGAMVEPAKTPSPNVRYVTHVILCDSRMWTSSEGKPLDAKLIAFEDLVAEGPSGSAAPAMPAPPANPTVTRAGKARLLVNGKTVEIALERLSRQDLEFIDAIKAALAKKAAGN